MRTFNFITVGKILELLHNEGLNITRSTFNRLETEGLFISTRVQKGKYTWRAYTKEEAGLIIELIKDNYRV